MTRLCFGNLRSPKQLPEAGISGVGPRPGRSVSCRTIRPLIWPAPDKTGFTRDPRTFFACQSGFLPVCPKQTGAQSATAALEQFSFNPRAATYASAVPATACPLPANCT